MATPTLRALRELYPSADMSYLMRRYVKPVYAGMPWPDLYALSEMSYYEGRRTKSKAMLLASALYAYAVLFPAGDAARPSPYSGQFTQAEDFYNLALTQVLSGAGAEGVVLKRRRALYTKHIRPGVESRDWLKRRFEWD